VTGSLASADEVRCAVLEVFLKGDAASSAAAQRFVETAYPQQRGLIVVFRDVTASDRDLDRYWKLVDHFQIEKPQLPAFLVSNRVEMGWDPAGTPPRLAEALTVEIFVRDGCAHCQAAHSVLFERLPARYPGYKFLERNLERTPGAPARLQELSQRYQVPATSVPAVHMCGRFLVGCVDAESGFRKWDAVLNAVTVPCPPIKTSRTLPRIPHGARASVGITLAAGMTAAPAWAVPALVGALREGAADDEAPPPRRPAPAAPVENPGDADPFELPPLQDSSPSETVVLPYAGEIRWKDWGLPAFTVLVGLIDGFNPCAMWVLLFLLSLLVNLHDRRKILAVAGTFVVISGAAYLAFMTAWLNVFQLIGLLRPAQVVLGLIGVGVGLIHVKDFFAFKRGLSLSIPESVKPGLYDRMRRIVQAESLRAAILGASVLAVLVNIVELLCTAGLPAMYTGVLTLQNLPPWQNHAYLLLYIVAYMFDDALMVAVVVVTLGRHKLQERGGRILKLISGLVILALGVVLLVRPSWLGS